MGKAKPHLGKISEDIHEAAEAAYHSYCEALANLPESPTEQELLYVCAMAIATERKRCLLIAKGSRIASKKESDIRPDDWTRTYFAGCSAGAEGVERAIKYPKSGNADRFTRWASGCEEAGNSL